MDAEATPEEASAWGGSARGGVDGSAKIAETTRGKIPRGGKVSATAKHVVGERRRGRHARRRRGRGFGRGVRGRVRRRGGIAEAPEICEPTATREIVRRRRRRRRRCRSSEARVEARGVEARETTRIRATAETSARRAKIRESRVGRPPRRRRLQRRRRRRRRPARARLGRRGRRRHREGAGVAPPRRLSAPYVSCIAAQNASLRTTVEPPVVRARMSRTASAGSFALHRNRTAARRTPRPPSHPGVWRSARRIS